MATQSYDKVTRTLTVVFTVQEDRILTWAVAQAGPQVMTKLLTTWLEQQQAAFRAREREAILARIPKATDAELSAVKAALGL